jgi:hypothetical protein
MGVPWDLSHTIPDLHQPYIATPGTPFRVGKPSQGYGTFIRLNSFPYIFHSPHDTEPLIYWSPIPSGSRFCRLSPYGTVQVDRFVSRNSKMLFRAPRYPTIIPRPTCPTINSLARHGKDSARVAAHLDSYKEQTYPENKVLILQLHILQND